jgi:uncharacterized membrane protein YgdD (TMEM256/DUF423 family)
LYVLLAAEEMGEIRMHAASRLFLSLAGVALCSAAALGAYGAHGLAASVTDEAWQAYMTAVDYQFYHGLGLGLIAVFVNLRPGVRAFRVAAWALIVGIVLFCGGIYATTFGAPAGLGRIVPVGGMAFMAGWLLLGLGGLLARERGPADPLA